MSLVCFAFLFKNTMLLANNGDSIQIMEFFRKIMIALVDNDRNKFILLTLSVRKSKKKMAPTSLLNVKFQL